VAQAKYITLLDLRRGYFQVKLTEKAKRYAAIVTTRGVFRPLRMLFGLRNAPFCFSNLMDKVLRGCEGFAIPYLDDIAVFSNSWEEHLKQIEEVFIRLRDANLTVKPSKCYFAQGNVNYLGHEVGQGKMTPATEKVEAILQLEAQKTKKGVRSLLGLVNYYRKYIPNYSSIIAPLTDLLKGKVKQGAVTWTNECEEAVKKIKDTISAYPVLSAPNFDKKFIVQCDACQDGVGICLSQKDEKGEEHPVLFLSKKFSQAERKYSTSEQECLAIIFAVKKLRYYLDNAVPFTIQTDHHPLTWLKVSADGNARIHRWALLLQEYSFDIEHRAGKKHVNADVLSRHALE